MTENYDSAPDTFAHIARVQELMLRASDELLKRASVHDASKLRAPEKYAFDRLTPKLKDSTYGSDEYAGFLRELQTPLLHHYANNSHHPEHYGWLECNVCGYFHAVSDKASGPSLPEDGACANSDCNGQSFSFVPNLNGMDLFDIMEMYFDWIAAGERHANGSMDKSIEHNRSRFSMSDQLVYLFRNTAKRYDY